MSTTTRLARAAALQAVLSLILAGACVAGGENQIGKNLYMRYCSACHGAEARGDGVVSQLMRPKPPDLTAIAKNAPKGEFPFYEVVRIIDGRETLRAHGDPDMPVWGELFAAEVGDSPDSQALARGKAILITDYLESIQAK